MSDDVVARLVEKMNEMTDRLARIEAMLQEKQKFCDIEHSKSAEMCKCLQEIKEKASFFEGAKAFIAWLITSAIAIYGAVFK